MVVTASDTRATPNQKPNLTVSAPTAKKDSRPEAYVPERLLQRWCRRWRLAMVRRLFVRIGEREQPAFVPGTAKDRQARGERSAARETHRDADCRKHHLR